MRNRWKYAAVALLFLVQVPLTAGPAVSEPLRLEAKAQSLCDHLVLGFSSNEPFFWAEQSPLRADDARRWLAERQAAVEALLADQAGEPGALGWWGWVSGWFSAAAPSEAELDAAFFASLGAFFDRVQGLVIPPIPERTGLQSAQAAGERLLVDAYDDLIVAWLKQEALELVEAAQAEAHPREYASALEEQQARLELWDQASQGEQGAFQTILSSFLNSAAESQLDEVQERIQAHDPLNAAQQMVSLSLLSQVPAQELTQAWNTLRGVWTERLPGEPISDSALNWAVRLWLGRATSAEETATGLLNTWARAKTALTPEFVQLDWVVWMEFGWVSQGANAASDWMAAARYVQSDLQRLLAPTDPYAVGVLAHHLVSRPSAREELLMDFATTLRAEATEPVADSLEPAVVAWLLTRYKGGAGAVAGAKALRSTLRAEGLRFSDRALAGLYQLSRYYLMSAEEIAGFAASACDSGDARACQNGDSVVATLSLALRHRRPRGPMWPEGALSAEDIREWARIPGLSLGGGVNELGLWGPWRGETIIFFPGTTEPAK